MLQPESESLPLPNICSSSLCASSTSSSSEDCSSASWSFSFFHFPPPLHQESLQTKMLGWNQRGGGWQILIRFVPERPSPKELSVSVLLTGLLENRLMPTTTRDNYRCMARVCSKQTILTKRSFSCSFFVFLLLLVVTRWRCLYILSSFILSIFLIRNKNEPRGWGSELETMLRFPARFGRIHLISWGLTTSVYGREVQNFVGSFTSVAHNVVQGGH